MIDGTWLTIVTKTIFIAMVKNKNKRSSLDLAYPLGYWRISYIRGLSVKNRLSMLARLASQAGGSMPNSRFREAQSITEFFGLSAGVGYSDVVIGITLSIQHSSY